MNKILLSFLTVASIGGCTAQPKSPSAELPIAPPATRPANIVATVGSKSITMEQLERPLVEAHGLEILLHLVQLELARQHAAEAGVTVTAADIAAERQLTLDTMFKEAVQTDGLKMTDEQKQEYRRKEYDRLLVQFLDRQRISMPEFNLAMETGAWLRKTASEPVRGMITEESLQAAFRIEYGERVRVRHIQLSNLAEWAQAKRRLDAGEPFEKVCAEMSRDEKSKDLGGVIRPFSRAEPMWPQAFKDAAFELKEPGEVSGPVSTGEAIHLIRLDEKIAPSAVKFEDHREILREKLYTLLIQVRIKQMREQLAAEARRLLQIQDPVLRKQYLDKIERLSGQGEQDPEQVRHQIEADGAALRRDAANTSLSSSGQGEVARPPATMPGQ